MSEGGEGQPLNIIVAKNQNKEKYLQSRGASALQTLEALSTFPEWQQLEDGAQKSIKTEVLAAFRRVQTLLESGGMMTSSGRILNVDPSLIENADIKGGYQWLKAQRLAHSGLNLAQLTTVEGEVIQVKPQDTLVMIGKHLVNNLAISRNGSIILKEDHPSEYKRGQLLEMNVRNPIIRYVSSVLDKHEVTRKHLSGKNIAEQLLVDIVKDRANEPPVEPDQPVQSSFLDPLSGTDA